MLPTVHPFFIQQTHSIIVENLPARPPLLSHFAATASSTITRPGPLPKKAPAYCTASSYQWYVGDGLSAEQLGGAYVIVCDAKLQAWRQGLAPTPLLHRSHCVALRARLTFTADSIISAVWDGDKKGCCLLILPPTEHPAALRGLAEKRRRRTPDGRLTGNF